MFLSDGLRVEQFFALGIFVNESPNVREKFVKESINFSENIKYILVTLIHIWS